MRDIDRVLADIGEIRSQLARHAVYRGFGPATVAATGGLAAAVALAQVLLAPAQGIETFLLIWVATALLACFLIGVEALTRSRRLHSRLADEMIVMAVELFLPAGAAGALLALVLWRCEPGALWMLPGLWQIFVSLGIFAAARAFPRAIVLAAAWYLVAALAVLVVASRDHAVSPWMMGLPFMIGQCAAAAILQATLGYADD